MRVADWLFKYLKQYGVRDIFMLAGGGSMYLDDALGKSGINYICNLHEQACAICASAYAQYRDKLGVCVLTTAPAGTNAMTGVAAAWLDSTPLLVITGQVKREYMMNSSGLRQRGFQELNVTDIARPITKAALVVHDPKDIKYCLQKAIYEATHDRKAPVWLDIPLDVQAAEIDESKLRPYEIAVKKVSPFLDKQVYKVKEMLEKSKRPVILAGHGIRAASGELFWYDNFTKFKALVSKLQVPVLTTWRMADFYPEDEFYSMGRPGLVGQAQANMIQNEADLLLSIGARLDLGQTGYEYKKFMADVKKIVVDIDYAEACKLSPDLAICADAGQFIDKLALTVTGAAGDSSWVKRCMAICNDNPRVSQDYYEDDKKYVNLYRLVDSLSTSMTESDILVPASSGQAAEVTMQAFRVKTGQRVLNFPALGSMGFGICSAIGACLASGKKRTICIEGDGSFAMNTQELETIRRLHLPIKILVLNNHGYGSIRSTQDRYFEGHYVGSSIDSGLTLPDIQSIARAYGIASWRLVNNYDLLLLDNWFEGDSPFVAEVMVNPKQQTFKP